MLKTKISYFLFLFIYQISFAQLEIPLEKENGISKISCLINGIPMKFVFDTGASNVSISKVEANFLYKQGLLTEEDFLDNVNYVLANGEIKEGLKINLKTINIYGLILENISAIVTDNQYAPLLFGQSAIEKIGKYTIDNNKLILHDVLISEGRHNDIRETLDWINSVFRSNEKWSNYFIEDLKFIDEDPFLIIIKKPGNCSDFDICKVPLKKIKPITFRFSGIFEERDICELVFKTRNGEEIVWYQNEDETCGQIGDSNSITLSPSIENNDLINRLKNAFTYLMSLYGNDGSDRF